jgi:hypothetical protein
MPKRTFETNEQAYNAVYNIFSEHSRSKHHFPKVYDVESSLKIHMDTYEIDPREIKVKIIKQRIDEISRQEERGISQEKLESLLGVGIWRYLKDLGYDSFSDLRYNHLDESIRKKFKTKEDAKKALRVRKKFATREDALKAFKEKVKEEILKEEYKSKDRTERKVGASIQNYNISWKKEVFYPVYSELIIEELEKNPKIGDEGIRKKFSFAQTFLKNQGGLVTFKIKNEISVTRREEDMLLRRLTLQAVKPKPEPATTEEDIWEFVKQKTGKPYNTFRIPQEIGYLKHKKKIEGSKLSGGYWKIE